MNPEEHRNTTTLQLEETLQGQGLMFREYRGDGFMTISEDTIFVVRDHEENDFEFIEVPIDQIQEVHVQEKYPSNGPKRGEPENEEDEEVEAVEENLGDCTKVVVWAASHATKFYTEEEPQTIASAFIDFRIS